MEALSPAAADSPSNSLPPAHSGGTTLYAQLFATAALLFFAAVYIRRERLHPAIPVVFLEEGKDYNKARQDWRTRAADVVNYGLNQIRKPFQVVSPVGPKIILPNRYVNEIKSDPRLSFGDWNANEFLAHLKGFEGFGQVLEKPIFADTIRTKLTQAIGNLTQDLCEESEATLLDDLGEKKEWSDITLKPFMLHYVARLSTRIFLGPELCCNEEWLEMLISYTVEAFLAVHELRKYPAFIRPLVNLYLPGPRRVRAIIARAGALIGPEIEKRRKRDAALEAKGERVKGKDTVRWMDEVAKGRPYDPIINQLFFSVAALHTTSDLLTHAMYDLVGHPEVMDELYKMKLMDSFLKESQRMNPAGLLVMNRVAREPVTLGDGTFIPKGAVVSCSMERLHDPTLYPDPDRFDAARFLRMRERPGQENNWQFVTTSEDHLGFGHGTHACPGRFFASNEAKIALAYMLLMYDWKLPEGVTERPATVVTSAEATANPTAKVSFRRRNENVPM